MERIDRKRYLSILKNFKDQQIIKVITGIKKKNVLNWLLA